MFGHDTNKGRWEVNLIVVLDFQSGFGTESKELESKRKNLPVTGDLKEVLLRVVKTHLKILVENTHVLRGEFDNNQTETFGLNHAGSRENAQLLVRGGVELVETRGVRLVDELNGLVDAFALRTGLEDHLVGWTQLHNGDKRRAAFGEGVADTEN